MKRCVHQKLCLRESKPKHIASKIMANHQYSSLLNRRGGGQATRYSGYTTYSCQRTCIL